MARELTDAEVFGGRELSDAEVFGSSAPTPAKRPPVVKKRDWRDEISDRARAVSQGFSLSFDDEFRGAEAANRQFGENLRHRVFGKPIERTSAEAYRETVDAERAAQSAYETAHPVENVMMQIGGGLLTPGLGAAASFISRGANLGAATARSLGVGAATGAIAGAGSADGDLGARAAGAGVGAIAGGALGAATPAFARGAGAVVNAVRPRAVDEAAGMAEAAAALTEAGVNVRSVSTATMGRIREAVRQGRNAREAALGILANEELPVPLPMTRGQRTGMPGQQLSENLMLRGARGSAAARQMRGFVGEQQDALRGNVNAMSDMIGGRPTPERNVGGAMVSDRLNSMYDTANEGVNQAYRAARQTGIGATLPREHGPVLGANLREGVRDFDLNRVPAVRDELNRIDALNNAGPINVAELFDARARLSSLRASSDGVEATAAGSAIRTLDAQLDDMVANDLLSGDVSSVERWREAIASRREFGRLFEGGDLIEALTERAPRGGARTLKVDPGDATNYILGRADLGLVGKRNLYRDVTRLRDVIGPESPEWNGIRAEVFQRLASKGEGWLENGERQFSGVNFNKAWNDFQRKDPRLARTMFSDEERAMISRFATLAARVTSSVRGGDNPSNTAVTGARLLANLRVLRGLPFIKEFANEVEVQLNLNQARAATSPTISRAQAPPGPVAQRAAAAAGTIAGGAAGAGIVRDGMIYWADGTVEPE